MDVFCFMATGHKKKRKLFNPPEYSNSLHRRFFVCSDQHEAKIKPEKSAAKTGEGADNFTPPKSLVNF